jgi:hypothetical protein
MVVAPFHGFRCHTRPRLGAGLDTHSGSERLGGRDLEASILPIRISVTSFCLR